MHPSATSLSSFAQTEEVVGRPCKSNSGFDVRLEEVPFSLALCLVWIWVSAPACPEEMAQKHGIQVVPETIRPHQQFMPGSDGFPDLCCCPMPAASRPHLS